MCPDGSIHIDTKIDQSGFHAGLAGMGKAAAKGIAVIGAGLAALGTYAFNVGSNFEAGMSEVAAISGAMGEDLIRLTAKAKEMGATTVFSATDSAEALKYMAMAGWDTEKMIDGLAGVMNLAAASGEDLGTVSDIVTDAMTAFGLEASQATHFADVLAQAANKSNTSVGLMGETFKYVAPVAGALGYSIEDMSLAIGLMANSGIKGSIAGTALRSTLTRMAKPTKESKKAMKELGISLTDAQGNMRPFVDIMGDMREGFSKLDEKQKATYASMLGGQEAMAGLLAIANASDEDFNALAAALNNADGAAEQMSKTMLDNLKGDIELAKSAAEDLGIAFYDSVQVPLRSMVQEGTALIGQLASAFETGGFEGLVSEIGTVLSTVVTKIATFAPKLAKGAVSVIISLVKGLRANMPAITGAAIEIGKVIVEGITEVIPEIAAGGLEMVSQIAKGIAEAFPGLVTAVGGMWNSLAQVFVDNIPMLIEAGIQFITAYIAGMAEYLPMIIQAGITLLTGLIQGIITAIPLLIEMLPMVIQTITTFLLEQIPIIIEAGIGLFNAILQALPTILEQLLAVLPTIITTISTFFLESVPMLVEAAIQLFNGLITCLPTVIEALVVALPSLLTAIVDALVANIQMIVDAGVSLLTALVNNMPAIIDAIVLALPQILTAITTALTDSIPQIVTAGIELLSAIIDNMPAILDAIVAALPEIITSLVTFFTDNLPTIVTAGIDLIVALAGGLIEAIPKLVEKLPEIVSAIITGIGDAVTGIWQVGVDIVNGLWGGISSLATDIGDKVKGFFTGIVDGIKDFLGIHSPSTLMADIGGNMVDGAMNGMEDKRETFASKARSFFSGIVGGIKKVLGIASPSKLLRDVIGKNMGLGVAVGLEATEGDVQKAMDRIGDVAKNTDIMANVKSSVRSNGLDIAKAREDSLSVLYDVADSTDEKELIDYDRLAKAIWDEAPDLDVKLDGESVGTLMEPIVSRLQARKTRGAARRAGDVIPT